jgi:3-oxoacyl-[acyl-carrier protein] reductase
MGVRALAALLSLSTTLVCGWSASRLSHHHRTSAPRMDDTDGPPPVAVVTGGSGGIGLACCHRLAARGSNVVIAYGRNDELAESACTELRKAYGCKVRSVRGDLTTDASRDATVEALFEAVDELGGRVSSFVHAAGFFHDQLLSHHFDGAAETFEVYDAYQSIYPKAFVAIAEKALQRMQSGGRMVAITNPGCNAMQTPRVGYDMPGQGKATMEFVVRMYALRVAKRGICVNAVSPAYTDTAEWDKARLAMGQGDMEKGREMLDAKMLSRSPVQRWAAPDEIAQAVDFLCAEQSGLITGATIPVDGGLHLV